ncbi:DUF5615 family PIN-like protein [Rufibacter sp. XAAS-G3-1]|uniref:DUF5615 family PIN-like protein n=1 Tax=Rufibacter sp. XAAS-G3-1 TaxID=2729134 RepID=UPI00351A7842
MAADEQRIVISKDSDFLESYLLKKVPPQLLLVKTGNIRNQVLLNLFEKHLSLIQELFSKHSLLEITQEEIVVHN